MKGRRCHCRPFVVGVVRTVPSASGSRPRASVPRANRQALAPSTMGQATPLQDWDCSEGARKALIDRRRWRHCARRGHRHLEVPARIRRPLQIQPALCAQLPAASASGSCAAPNTLQLSGGSARERHGEGGNYCKALAVKSKLLKLYHRAPSRRKSDFREISADWTSSPKLDGVVGSCPKSPARKF